MSEPEETAGALFRAGRLSDAVKAANLAVRGAPGNIVPRILLAELLVFAGNLERADVMLDAASDIEPQAALVIAEFRQLLRAETARNQVRFDGRLPEFLGEPTPGLAAMLEAHVAMRAGDPAAAAALVAKAEQSRPAVAGTMTGQGPGTGHGPGIAFEDFRDADDLCIGFFEVLTTTGKYFWIPTEHIETVAFYKPARARDLYWRRASMSIRGGPNGDVYVPAIYTSNDASLGDGYRLGRSTDWIEQADAPVNGIGQRMFLGGNEAVSIMELVAIDFDHPGRAP